MTPGQVQKLSVIFRQVREVMKNSIDDIAQLAENALNVLADEETANPAKLLSQIQHNELLTKKELAQRLKISERSISTLQAEGLPVHSFGKSIRFDYEEVVIWAKNRKIKGRGKTKLRVVS